MEVLAQLLINGLSVGAVYALFALGYTLVFSVLGVINFAHGALFTLGAYLTYLLLGGAVGSNGALAGLQLPLALPLWAALPLAGLGTAAASLVVEAVAFRPLRRRGAEPLLYLITSLGAGVILVKLIQFDTQLQQNLNFDLFHLLDIQLQLNKDSVMLVLLDIP